MDILKFKQFESLENDFDFPTFSEVEDYFYDFTDEIDSKLDGYQSGFKFYLKSNPGVDFKNTISKKSNFIDILNTDIPDKRLEFCSYYCYIESINFVTNMSYLESIKNGAKAYKHLMIKFDTLFSESKLDLLIECLKRFYHAEGFRPYGDLWVDIDELPERVEEKLGFVGMLVNCSDEEYIKLSQLIELAGLQGYAQQREFNKKLIKHFI